MKAKRYLDVFLQIVYIPFGAINMELFYVGTRITFLRLEFRYT
jgi:hypothetical protein